MSALKEEVAAEKSRVDFLAERQRVYSAALKRQMQAQELMQTVSAACSIFGSPKGGNDSIEKFTLSSLESTLNELQTEELIDILDASQLDEIRLATAHLKDSRSLIQWAVQSSTNIINLCKTKQAEDFAIAVTHAAAMKDELDQSVHAVALLKLGDDNLSKAWKICEAVIEKDAKDRAKSEGKHRNKDVPKRGEGVVEQKDAGISSGVSINAAGKPLHVKKAVGQNEWLRAAVALRDKNRSEGHSRELNELLKECTDKIRELSVLSSERRNTDTLVTVIAQIESNVSSSIAIARTNESFTSPVQYILLEILTPLLDAVILADNEEMVMMLGHVCGALCRMTGKTGGELLLALLACASTIVVPVVGGTMRISGLPVAEGQEQQRRVVMLMACQMCSFEAPPTSDLSVGWSWLVRMGVLLHQQASSSSSLGLICMCIRSFLRIAGVCLRQTYGKQFMTLLQTTLHTLPSSDKSAAVDDLRQLLVNATKEGRIPSVLFKNQDAYGIYACSVVRQVFTCGCDSLQH